MHREGQARTWLKGRWWAFAAPPFLGPTGGPLGGQSSSREQLAGLSLGPCHPYFILHPREAQPREEASALAWKCGQTHPPDFGQEEVGESLKTTLVLFVLMGFMFFLQWSIISPNAL